MDSVVEEEDYYEEENTSHFEMITNMNKRKFTIGLHHRRVNPLPAKFKFPKGMTLFQLVTNWLIGNINQNIPLFQHLCSDFIKHDKNTAKHYNCVKILTNYIESKANKHQYCCKKSNNWAYQRCVHMWGKRGQKFILNPFTKV